MKGNGFCDTWMKRAGETEAARDMVDDMEWRCEEQGYVFRLWDILRHITQGCVEDEEAYVIEAWWDEVENYLGLLGVQD